MSKLQLTKKELIKLLKNSNTYITQTSIKTSTPLNKGLAAFGFTAHEDTSTSIRIDLTILDEDEDDTNE